MNNEIILKMSKEEFDAMMAMIEDNATSIDSAEEDFSLPTLKNIDIFNKMLKRNKINTKINH